ncbi:cytochrome C552 [Kurthia sp. 3B1D]|uniref:D-alanyl carrier protein n=2 Tax=Kurthia TaxID=1649 RepID=A0A433RW77_9BACL|nr:MULTISPECIES: D-alanine--poly(phosphoribitol) ligase subunit DltC [unclassified Kurthia]RUS57547.1 cytochrome C552 [Kurthia sp. 3B1D]HIX43380.1 D-alanine--poly(phosphoribitol) ligase subunit DltC [Candidatus Kurthia intestinigallinarum]
MNETLLAILEEVTGADVRDDLDLDLYEEGILDSFGTVQLLVEIDGQLGIQVPVSDFEREDWRTPNKIIATVGSLA